MLTVVVDLELAQQSLGDVAYELGLWIGRLS